MHRDGDYIYSQGCKTGAGYSEVKDLEYNYINRLRKITIDHDSDGGDSGGPYYRRDINGDAQIAGCHAWGVGGQDGDAKGNVMQYLETDFNITI